MRRKGLPRGFPTLSYCKRFFVLLKNTVEEFCSGNLMLLNNSCLHCPNYPSVLIERIRFILNSLYRKMLEQRSCLDLKVIGAGLGRTGTASTRESMRILDYWPCYHRRLCYKVWRHLEGILAAMPSKCRRNAASLMANPLHMAEAIASSSVLLQLLRPVAELIGIDTGSPSQKVGENHLKLWNEATKAKLIGDDVTVKQILVNHFKNTPTNKWKLMRSVKIQFHIILVSS